MQKLAARSSSVLPTVLAAIVQMDCPITIPAHFLIRTTQTLYLLRVMTTRSLQLRPRIQMRLSIRFLNHLALPSMAFSSTRLPPSGTTMIPPVAGVNFR